MIAIIIILLVILIIGMSLRTLLFPTALQEKYISWQSFIYLLMVFTTIVIGFSLIYVILIRAELMTLFDNGVEINKDLQTTFFTSFYFSGVTLFSIGYGDVTPSGIGRMIAVIQGLIGYTIPAAFVVRTVIDIRRERER